MKACRGLWMLFVLSTAAFCAGSLWGTVQPISGALFDPPLVPTTNTAYIGASLVTDRVIVEDATLIALEVNSLLYTDVEGPTNAIVTAVGGTTVYSPFLNTSIPTYEESVTGLTLDGLFNFSSVKVMFAGRVTTETEGGFFATEYGASDDVYVYPLDGNGARIGAWQLYLTASDYGSGTLLKPHGYRLAVKNIIAASSPVGVDRVGGVAFTLKDFTGGSGVLNNVRGLEFADPSPAFDLVVAGIYRGKGEPVVYRAGRAVPMRNATFDQPLVNPMTNDFALTGFDGAASITAPAQVYQFDTLSDSSVLWPVNGVNPTRTDALLGLGINGVKDMIYWDFMFSEPVTNTADGFFIIDEISTTEVAFVYPLDAERRPISTYAIATLPNRSQWEKPPLMNGGRVCWAGPIDSWAGTNNIGGVVMPLAAFAGGTGGLTQVHGIRVYYHELKWSAKRLDPLVVGSYKAARLPRPVYDVETDPMPTPKLNANHIATDYLRHDWTLKSITLDTGRYTDLEGPTNMTRTATDGFRAYPIDGTAPGTALAAALGLNGWISVNPGTCYWYFETAVTNGFDGGFFFFNDNNDDSVKFEPLDANGNLIAGGYSVVIDKSRDLGVVPQSFMGITWKYYAVTDTNPAANPNWDTSPRGTAFTLNCFTNGAGASLTNDVKGLKLTYVYGNADVVMVGIYKGPTVPPRAGIASPITAATFTPPLGGSPYSNDAAVASVRSADSASFSVSGPSSVAVLMHNGVQVFFPFNGTNPDPNPGAPYTEGYTNALDGLDVDGIANLYTTEYMFDRPVRKADEGFFIIEVTGDDFILVRPLDVNRTPISTYSVRIDNMMMGDLGVWRINSIIDAVGNLRGTLIRRSDFDGGTGELGDIYGVRIEEPGGEFDPAVVGQWFGPPEGTLIFLM